MGTRTDADLKDIIAHLAAENFERCLPGWEAIIPYLTGLTTPKAMQEAFDLPYPPGMEQYLLIMRTLSCIASGQRIIKFPGAAGSGKTTSCLIVLAIFKAARRDGLVCALSWQAATRAADVLGLKPKTLSSITYMGLSEDEKDEDLLTPNMREEVNDKIGDYVVIDEYSMVDEKTFGDCVDASPRGTVFLLVGDPEQIPQIEGEPIAGDFEAQEWYMDEVFRQKDGYVLDFATNIRRTKTSPIWSPDDFSHKHNSRMPDEFKVPNFWGSPKQAADRLFKLAVDAKKKRIADEKAGAKPIEDNNLAIAIVATHRSRCALNDAMRLRLGFPGRRFGPAPKERIVAMASGGYFRNSERGKVISSTFMEFAPGMRGWACLMQKDSDPKGVLTPAVVMAESWMAEDARERGRLRRDLVRGSGDMEGLRERIKVAYGEVDSEERIRVQTCVHDAVTDLYDEFRADNRRVTKKDRTLRTFNTLLAENPTMAMEAFVAQIDTAYAITAWKAQGSEWDAVLVIMDYTFRQFTAEEQHRYWYSVCTRARHTLCLVKKSKGVGPGTWKPTEQQYRAA